MPKFLKLLFFVELWERFSYYGMRALLILFLTKSLGFTDPKAYALYSLFAALGYAAPVVGGILADRIFGFRRMVVIGGVVMCLGHGLMALTELWNGVMYFGLGFIAIGTGLFKGNVSNLLGCCYAPEDPNRDKGFTLFYVAVNLGSVLASLACGYVGEKIGWHYGFGLAGVGMVLGLIVFLKYQSVLEDHGMEPNPEVLVKPYWGLKPMTWIYLGTILVGCLFAFMMTSAETIPNF